jgi:hypothetical protein
MGEPTENYGASVCKGSNLPSRGEGEKSEIGAKPPPLITG